MCNLAQFDSWESAPWLHWSDLLVLSAAASLVVGTRRRALALLSPLLFWLAFPPFSLPTWCCCYSPLIAIWRDRRIQLSRFRLLAEAIAIGFAMAWISTGFVRTGFPARGYLLHSILSLLFSLQIVSFAFAIRLSRSLSVISASLVSTLGAVLGEGLEACFGITWALTTLSLTVGATPLAQWSRLVTPFGVSALLYFVNTLLIVPRSERNALKWSAPLLAVAVLGSAWGGGTAIESGTPVKPLPFSAILVQPHEIDAARKPWLKLDRMTRDALREGNPPDLIVWPETSLSESWMTPELSTEGSLETHLNVCDFARILRPQYRTNALVGTIGFDRRIVRKYGLNVEETRRFNCGCLISSSGSISWHQKLDLVPLREGLPRYLEFDWFRHRVVPVFGFEAPLTPGTAYGPLKFETRKGSRTSIAVSVCYESFNPALPQYSKYSNVDAVIHLVYDGYYADNTGMMERQLLACRYRAIETRKWNLVCSTLSGTSVIDPAGKVVRRLNGAPGLLSIP